ncbi:hypothetical protein GB931_15335 [Modestobacter sp. I12A-02628]|uniref:Uncharacterized protein n=1 Tax=Goekera deserti TaxID=2497753 RepID=A0A7K3WAD3_9ACTN|nr:hypothetical protein [Goekera deserti]MPQ99265.1 hypothetical protein [Goekera deserti]NDI47600.1 hypothetical protein [Goekera deserti]NDI47663.1 hypothetical protein [Goekera deserti]NEL53411.1 hypothetical protein [Goekera deserti]
MIVLCGALVLAGIGLLVAGVAEGSPPLQWSAVAVSATATVLLVLGAARARALTAALPGGGSARSRRPDRDDVHHPVRLPTPATERTATAPTAARSGAGGSTATVSTVTGPGVTVPTATGTTAGPPAAAPATASTAAPTGRQSLVDGEPVSGGRHGHTGEHAVLVETLVPVAAARRGRARHAAPDPPTDSGPDSGPVTGPAAHASAAVLPRRPLDRHRTGHHPAGAPADVVLVVDEQPLHHRPSCARLVGQATVPLPLAEARAHGFAPCEHCTPAD